mgnify:CR=1 FL=1
MEMLEIARLLAPVALGGIIGAFTNFLAIKMLFCPYNEKRIFGFALPFTPGIIPKRQKELAKAIGRVVSENLVNADGISKMLLADETIDKLKMKIDGIIRSLQTNEESVQSFFCKYAGDERVNDLMSRVKNNLETKINDVVSDDNVG